MGGREERQALIASHFGTSAYDSVVQQLRGNMVKPDDIADAFAALWTAKRLMQGVSVPLVDPSTVDGHGLKMCIWY